MKAVEKVQRKSGQSSYMIGINIDQGGEQPRYNLGLITGSSSMQTKILLIQRVNCRKGKGHWIYPDFRFIIIIVSLFTVHMLRVFILNQSQTLAGGVVFL